jgi:HD-GYP domain-containing protein (c-di-GMP phosphodiesterase class II)
MGSAKGYLKDHGPRVAMLAHRLGMEFGLDSHACSELVFAAVLSDMGMVGLAEDAWENPVASLDDDARARVRQHPERSEVRVREIPHLESLGALVRHHHEWWDGSGYPDGLAGEDIPLGARILRLADTVTALAGARPHREPWTLAQIAGFVRSGQGEEFGPDVAAAYLDLVTCGEPPLFDQALYRETVMSAAGRLLPVQVAAPSTHQLLSIVANLIDAKDPYTGGHSRRVAMLAVSVADEMGLPGHVRASLWASGYLHDLGKLAVPLRVLAKEGSLTEEEFDFIRAHPSDGAAILGGIPTLRHLTEGVRHHHERWDGRGYPDRLAGNDIPLVAQIMAVCDAYDAMTSKRAYRSSLGSDYALNEVARERGGHFGPDAADGFLSISRDVFEGLHRSRTQGVRDVPVAEGRWARSDRRWGKSQARLSI